MFPAPIAAETSRRARPLRTGSGEALAAEIPDARLVRLVVRLDRVGHRLPAHASPAVADELLAHTAG